jgi:hypothetical protein
MAAFVAALTGIIPVVQTILSDVKNAIDKSKTASAQTAGNSASMAVSAQANSQGNKDKRSHEVASDLATTASKSASQGASDAADAAKDAATQAINDHMTVPGTQQPLSQAQSALGAEVMLVATFLGPCSEAEDNVIKIQTLLATRKDPATLTQADRLSLKTSWDTTKTLIGKLKDPMGQVDTLEHFDQTTFENLFSSNSVNLEAIDNQVQVLIDSKSAVADLNSALDAIMISRGDGGTLPELKGALNAINGLGLIVVGDVGKALAGASKAEGA